MKNLYFYQRDRIATVLMAGAYRTIFQTVDHLFAEYGPTGTSGLLVTDRQRTVMQICGAQAQGRTGKPYSYTPYGSSPRREGDDTLLAFTGERRDTTLSGYWLGNGYRHYASIWGRFNSPDSWSPFGRGGINAYAYCVGDPVNYTDPSGHAPPPTSNSFGLVKNRFTPKNSSPAANPQTHAVAGNSGSRQTAVNSKPTANAGQVVRSTESEVTKSSSYSTMDSLPWKEADEFVKGLSHEGRELAQARSGSNAYQALWNYVNLPSDSLHYRGVTREHADLVVILSVRADHKGRDLVSTALQKAMEFAISAAPPGSAIYPSINQVEIEYNKLVRGS